MVSMFSPNWQQEGTILDKVYFPKMFYCYLKNRAVWPLNDSIFPTADEKTGNATKNVKVKKNTG